MLNNIDQGFNDKYLLDIEISSGNDSAKAKIYVGNT